MSVTGGFERAPMGIADGHVAHLFGLGSDCVLCADPTSDADAHRGLPKREAARMRQLIEAAVAEVFGVPRSALCQPSRGKAPIALARQAAMYLAHVSCGLNLTDVGQIFARDRTTVAHACAVIEDRRDNAVFDRALELMEWIVPSLVARGSIHSRQSA